MKKRKPGSHIIYSPLFVYYHLLFQGFEEALHCGVVMGFPLRDMLISKPCAFNSSVYSGRGILDTLV